MIQQGSSLSKSCPSFKTELKHDLPWKGEKVKSFSSFQIPIHLFLWTLIVPTVHFYLILRYTKLLLCYSHVHTLYSEAGWKFLKGLNVAFYFFPHISYLHFVQQTTSHRVWLSVSRSAVSDSLRPHGLQSTRLLCPWNSPGKNTGMDCHFLLQDVFPTQRVNLGLLHCK